MVRDGLGSHPAAVRGSPVTAIGESSAQMALRDPDVRLMLRVRADEPGAFAELVGQYQHRLIAVLCHLIGDATEAEDLAQEAFLRVYRARKEYQPRCKFSTWLFTIANNLARNSLRSRQRKPVTPLLAGDPTASGPQELSVKDNRSGPMKKVERKELAGLIQEALAGLNERQRTAVVLNKFEDMNYAEIAEIMGLTTKGVKSLLSRARLNLRAALAGYVYMDGAPTPEEVSEEP
jgi:RNA polymerase sigma-70 factor (ECF subfamily)